MNVITVFFRRACLVCAFAVLVGQAHLVSAQQTVLVDFGNNQSFRGVSVSNPDSKSHYWNSIAPGLATQNLIDVQNNPTTIGLQFSTPVATDSYNGPAGPTQPLPPAFPTYASFVPLTDIDQNALGNLGGALEAAFDFAAGPDLADDRVRFEIQQLDPTKKYSLTFFGSHNFSTDTSTVYSVYTDNTYSTLVSAANLNVQSPVDPSIHNRDTVATIAGLWPQSGNSLFVQFVGSNGHDGYLNAMQISSNPVPEPRCAALLVGSAIWCFVRRSTQAKAGS
jgi:hypothetical protein